MQIPEAEALEHGVLILLVMVDLELSFSEIIDKKGVLLLLFN
jgi:hypothetical protein